jgi:hypothetical protein
MKKARKAKSRLNIRQKAEITALSAFILRLEYRKAVKLYQDALSRVTGAGCSRERRGFSIA